MEKVETFPKPPITEALIDIRVELPSETTLEILKNYHEPVKEMFPEKKERFTWAGEIEFDKEKAPKVTSVEGGINGFLFMSEQDHKIVQARLDGFTFNKLKPYKNWDSLSEEAKILWETYIKLAKPKRVTRIAVRYINKIYLPIESGEVKLEQFFNTYPEFSPDIPYKLDNYFMRLFFHDPDIGAKAIVNQTIEKVEKDAVPFILDIDVFLEINTDPEDKKIWENFSLLRNFKNTIFHKSITDKTKEFFR